MRLQLSRSLLLERRLRLSVRPPGETAAGPAHQLPGPFLSLARRGRGPHPRPGRPDPGRPGGGPARDGFDYLYSVDRLADLPGKKLHAKRNHIHRLDEACPGWTWAPLTQADIPACLAMDAAWHQDALTRETVRGLSTLDDEHRALVLALEHLPALGLEGIVLRWQDTLLGFTLGAPLTETIFDVHFERARGEIQGAYPAVNRSFARYIRQKYPHIRYLDREDDMGLPGLRKAKLSYAPDYLQVNFSAVECRAP